MCTRQALLERNVNALMFMHVFVHVMEKVEDVLHLLISCVSFDVFFGGGDVRENRLDGLRVGTFLSFFHFPRLSGRRTFNTNESHTSVAGI